MHTRAIHNRKLHRLVTVRPLQDGDTETVAAVFARLGDAARASRFHGGKPRLSERELAQLASVGPASHVLVAYVGGDPRPAALARLARDAADPSAAEVAFEVADRYQGNGLGTQLVELLLEDARAAGIRRVDAWVELSNSRALALLRRVLGGATRRVEDGEVLVAASL